MDTPPEGEKVRREACLFVQSVRRAKSDTKRGSAPHRDVGAVQLRWMNRWLIVRISPCACASAHRLASACYISSVAEDVARKGAGPMRWFKPKFPLVNVTSDPDRHIKLNRLASRGTPAQSTCEPGRERQRELMLWDITVCTVRHSKDFRERVGELLDPPYSISVEGHREKYIMALFNRTDLKKTRAAR
jgi:hypothetical protein